MESLADRDVVDLVECGPSEALDDAVVPHQIRGASWSG
jgi:hypothetical protein